MTGMDYLVQGKQARPTCLQEAAEFTALSGITQVLPSSSQHMRQSIASHSCGQFTMFP